MSSRTSKRIFQSAAWPISLWATLAFACGTIIVFVFLQQYMAGDIRRRTDDWLAGEVEVLGDVAERTPKDALYARVVSEVAELASNEVPNRESGDEDEIHNGTSPASNESVFFLQIAADGSPALWVGAGDGQADVLAIQKTAIPPDKPTDLQVQGFPIPFRVASAQIRDGSHIYLALSERDEIRVLRNLTFRFLLLSLSFILFGFLILFLSMRRMLNRVRTITEAASRIGQSDLTTRVPTTNRNDEIAQLALTLNHMLDRIENTVHQLHTITDSLAHDLRSPLTAIRGKLEMSLPTVSEEQAEIIVSAIEELDRVSDFLNKSLDVAEARADALRLAPSEIDLCQLLRTMADLYEPSMCEKGLVLKLHCDDGVQIIADAALLHRMIANLFDNALKHLRYGCQVSVRLRTEHDKVIITFEDNGPGFEPGILEHLFQARTKGRMSTGHGLGLAFVNAVARAHGGSVAAMNRASGGAEITLTLPTVLNSQVTSRLADTQLSVN